MENQFSRIGQLIYDLEANIALDTRGSASFLEEEFRRISLQLCAIWTQKAPGLPYLLEFHRVECERLLQKARLIYERFIHISLFREDIENLKALYVHLISVFHDLLENIDLMVGDSATKTLNSSVFN